MDDASKVSGANALATTAGYPLPAYAPQPLPPTYQDWIIQEGARTQTQMHAMVTQVNKLQATVDKMCHGAAADVQDDDDELAAVKKQLLKIKAENDGLRESEDAAKEEARQLLEKTKGLEQAKKDLRRGNDELRRANEDLREAKDGLCVSNGQLARARKNAESKLGELESANKCLREAAVRGPNGSAKELAALRAAVAELRRERDQAFVIQKQLDNERHAATEECHTLREQLACSAHTEMAPGSTDCHHGKKTNKKRNSKKQSKCEPKHDVFYMQLQAENSRLEECASADRKRTVELEAELMCMRAGHEQPTKHQVATKTFREAKGLAEDREAFAQFCTKLRTAEKFHIHKFRAHRFPIDQRLIGLKQEHEDAMIVVTSLLKQNFHVSPDMKYRIDTRLTNLVGLLRRCGWKLDAGEHEHFDATEHERSNVIEETLHLLDLAKQRVTFEFFSGADQDSVQCHPAEYFRVVLGYVTREEKCVSEVQRALAEINAHLNLVNKDGKFSMKQVS